MDIYSEVISNTAMSSNFINTLYIHLGPKINNFLDMCIIYMVINDLGANLRYMGYFLSFLHPQLENLDCYHESETYPGVLKNHVLLSFFCGQNSENCR